MIISQRWRSEAIRLKHKLIYSQTKLHRVTTRHAFFPDSCSVVDGLRFTWTSRDTIYTRNVKLLVFFISSTPLLLRSTVIVAAAKTEFTNLPLSPHFVLCVVDRQKFLLQYIG